MYWGLVLKKIICRFNKKLSYNLIFCTVVFYARSLLEYYHIKWPSQDSIVHAVCLFPDYSVWKILVTNKSKIFRNEITSRSAISYLSSYFNVYFRWYFGKIKRVEAEKKLLSLDNEHGAFLIRDSESRRNDYSLSGNILFTFYFKNDKSKKISCLFLFFSLKIKYVMF